MDSLEDPLSDIEQLLLEQISLARGGQTEEAARLVERVRRTWKKMQPEVTDEDRDTLCRISDLCERLSLMLAAEKDQVKQTLRHISTTRNPLRSYRENMGL